MREGKTSARRWKTGGSKQNTCLFVHSFIHSYNKPVLIVYGAGCLEDLNVTHTSALPSPNHMLISQCNKGDDGGGPFWSLSFLTCNRRTPLTSTLASHEEQIRHMGVNTLFKLQSTTSPDYHLKFLVLKDFNHCENSLLHK